MCKMNWDPDPPSPEKKKKINKYKQTKQNRTKRERSNERVFNIAVLFSLDVTEGVGWETEGYLCPYLCG